MKRSNSIISTIESGEYYSAWDIIIFGTRNNYKGIEPETALITSVCNKALRKIVCNDQKQEIYWKNHVKEKFEIFKDDYQSMGPVWSRVFSRCINKINKIANHSMEIFLNASNRNIFFKLLQPIIPYLNKTESNPIGHLGLAICYENGYGVDKNRDKAFNYYKISAEHGNAIAQFNIACHYKSYHNPELAFKYFKLSMDNGHDHASFLLGSCYANGYGVNKNPKKAYKYYKHSADQGLVIAQLIIANCYAIGYGVTKNPEEAYKYYKICADQGFRKSELIKNW